MPLVSAVSFVLLALAGYAGQIQPATSKPKESCVIRIAEMSDDLAVFEVFLPATEARRKGVVHKVVDETGTTVATERFGTANGHYKVAMIGSYFAGRAYRFIIDGRYDFRFVFDPTS